MADFRCLVVVFILSLLAHQGATADVFVMFTGPDGNEIDFDVEQDPISGEWEVYLNHTRDGSGGTFHIRSTSNATDTIAFIRCNLDDPFGVTVSVEMNPNNDALVRTVRSIYSVNTAKIVVSQCVVTHDVESIEVDRIGSITAGGSIYGPITITEGNLDTLSAGSNITTDLSVTDGLIKNIEAGAAVGSLSTPVSITAHDYVRRVTGTSVHANINVTGNGSPYGAFGRLVTTSGDFTGSLTCERIVPIDQGQYNVDFDIAGDLVADIDCERYLQYDVTLYIAGSLDGDLTFTSETESQLQGQIIINAGNGGGEWNGAISIDETTISGPNYTQTSAQLGGGAVGLAPFNFHATNCVPAHSSTVTSEPSTVTLSHYGPVEKHGDQ